MGNLFGNHKLRYLWAGYAISLIVWYACVKWLPIAPFQRLPDPVTVIVEWLSRDPSYGLSLFTPGLLPAYLVQHLPCNDCLFAGRPVRRSTRHFDGVASQGQ